MAPIDSVQDLQISHLDQAILHVKHAAFNDGGEKVASRAIIQGGIHESLVVVEASNRNNIRMVTDKPLKRDLPGFSSRFLPPLTYTLDGENRAGLDLESTIDSAETTGANLFDEFDLSRPNGLSGHVWKISRREVHDAAKAARAKDINATRAIKEQKKARVAKEMEEADQAEFPLTFPFSAPFIPASETLSANIRVGSREGEGTRKVFDHGEYR